MKKLSILLTALCLIISCGKSDSVDTKPVDTKPVDTKPVDTKPIDPKPIDPKPVTSLFSKWRDGKGGYLDFTGCSFNAVCEVPASGGCIILAAFTGDQNSGYYLFKDEMCGSGKINGQYTKTNITLTLCTTYNCATLYK